MSLENLWGEIDHFFWCHYLGWFFIFLAIRDLKLSFMLATLDELFEVAFKFILPFLGECWYDSWFLDLIVSNGGGIITGYFFMKYIVKFELYDFFGSNGSKSIKEWKYWKNSHRILSIGILSIFKLLFMVNSFFGMNALWISPVSKISKF